MKYAPRILVSVAALNFFVPLLALYLITARELVQERDWEAQIKHAHSDAFRIGSEVGSMREQNERAMADVFWLIVQSRRQAVGILNASMYISWASSAVLILCAYKLAKKGA